MAKAKKKSSDQGGKFFPALCNVIGTLILLAVILSALPLVIPRYLGYEIYDVVSGSMEPAIPVGSVVYVEPAEADSIEPGEIVAFHSNDSVITHRVVENRTVSGELITKGDANEGNDINPVPYSALIGRVKLHIPMVGHYMMIYSNQVVKVYLIILALCGLLFNVLAASLRNKQTEKFRLTLERYELGQAEELQAELDRLRKR